MELFESKNVGIMKNWDVKKLLISGLLLLTQERPVRTLPDFLIFSEINFLILGDGILV